MRYLAACLLCLYIAIQWLIGFRGSWFSDDEWYYMDQLATCFAWAACLILFPHWFKVVAFAILMLACVEMVDQAIYKNTQVHLHDYIVVLMVLLTTLGFVFIRLKAKRKS